METSCCIVFNHLSAPELRAVCQAFDETTWCYSLITDVFGETAVSIGFGSPPAHSFKGIRQIAKQALAKTEILYRSFKGVLR